MTVVPPFFPLVAQEEVKDVLAERRLAISSLSCITFSALVQALRQRLDAEGCGARAR
jgi:hypothetical protein